MYSIIEMLGYMRPQGSDAQQLFCERFIEPTFGKPDEHGNYILQIGHKLSTALLHTMTLCIDRAVCKS